MSYKLNRYNRVIRLLDGAWLPCTYDAGVIVALDEHSLFVREFKAWVALGNVPLPADPPAVPIDLSDLDNLDRAIKSNVLLTRQYANQQKAGTYVLKSISDTRADFMTIYRALP